MTSELVPNKYRTLFLSDFHLGSLNCKAERLYKFLLSHTADKIYLVGDVFEGWQLGRWPLYHDMVVGILAAVGSSGTEIIYIPGNHDSIFRQHLGSYGSLSVKLNATHHCIDGRRLLVTHGDESDCVRLGPVLGLLVYLEQIIGVSLWNNLRKYFSRRLARHGDAYRRKMMQRSRAFDGVICGHIHEPALTQTYLNCGDWTHHCTAIAEHADGRFELLQG